MNLKQHIIETPSHAADLAAIQNHSETSLRMISNKTMMLYLKATGLYLYIHQVADGVHDVEGVDHAAKETCLMIKNSLLDGSADGGDFNFMEGTAKGDGVIADTEALKITIPTKSANLDGLLTVCKEHCNSITYPFADTTQADIDAVNAELALIGELEAHSYTIGGFPTNEPDAFIIKTRELICDVIFDAPVPIDCTVKNTFYLLDATTGLYVPESVADSVRVSKDSRSKNYRIKRSFSARKMKCVAVCSHNLPFQVKVREA